MKYLKTKKILNRIQNIEGWFSKEAGLFIALLDEFQIAQKISGDIFEIGVHHGKSTIFFSHLLGKSENINVCDVFELQGDNLSNSGKGNKHIFLKNIKKHSSKDVNTIYTCLSSELSIDKTGSGYRMFHIDGGHNATEALNDLILASKAIHEKGIIILDDPFRPEWPGVTEALTAFLKKHRNFVSIAVGFNKLIIAKKEASANYIKFLGRPENLKSYRLSYPIYHKQLPFCGWPLIIFYVPSYINPKSVKILITRILRNSILYKMYSKQGKRNGTR